MVGFLTLGLENFSFYVPGEGSNDAGLRDDGGVGAVLLL